MGHSVKAVIAIAHQPFCGLSRSKRLQCSQLRQYAKHGRYFRNMPASTFDRGMRHERRRGRKATATKGTCCHRHSAFSTAFRHIACISQPDNCDFSQRHSVWMGILQKSQRHGLLFDARNKQYGFVPDRLAATR